MTHDPLCPWAQENVFNHRGECFLIEGSEPPISSCDLIVKVRSDERDRCIEIVSDTYTENWRDCAWNSAVAWSLAHLRGES